MAIEIGAVRASTANSGIRPWRGVSMRTALIAGVAALGIASALPDGATLARSEFPAIASSAAPARVSQDVELMAYIPGWTEAMVAIDTIAYNAEPLVTSVVNSTLVVGMSIPVVNVVARQAYIVYNYVIWPVVWLPLTCGTLFLGTLDVGYLNHLVAVTVDLFAGFVQAEANFFLYGGWNPLAVAATAAKAKAAAHDGAGDAEKASDSDQPRAAGTGVGKSGRTVAPIGATKNPTESATAAGAEAPTDSTPQAGSPTLVKSTVSAQIPSAKGNGRTAASSTGSTSTGAQKSAGTGHHARKTAKPS
jgi:hypothetical protein